MPRVALILLPGILGTDLRDPYGEGWPCSSSIDTFTKYYRKPTFKKVETLTSKKLTVKVTKEIDGSDCLPDIYKEFISFCKEQKTTPVRVFRAVGYNWTKTNWDSGFDIFFKTKEIMRENENDGTASFEGFFYVTHSMGALAGRVALTRMKYIDPQLYDKCIGVIHVVAPHWGAPESIMRFLRGVKGDGLVGGITAKILSNKGWKASYLMSHIPSMIELMPAKRGSGGSAKLTLFSDELLKQLTDLLKKHFDEYSENAAKKKTSWLKCQKRLAETVSKLEENFSEARKFHYYLSSDVFERTAMICMTGKETVEDVTEDKDKEGELNHVEAQNGDGTVPLDSQSLGWANNTKGKNRKAPRGNIKACHVFDNGIDHADVFTKKGKDAGIFDKIFKCMDEMYEIWKNLDTDSSSAPSEGSVQPLDASSS